MFVFGELLKGFRKRAELTQQELANLIERDRNTISAWERSVYLPDNREIVLRLADELSLSPTETDELLYAAKYPLEYQTLEPDQEPAVHTIPALTRPPLQRPPPVPHFTGRETELEYLLAHLRPGCGITLCGPGGIGKTALVAEALRRLAPGKDPPERFPDGIIWHNFQKQPRVIQALGEIVRAFGENPHRGTPANAAKRALAGRQALLVLEGTEVADDLAAIVEVRGGCGVLITTQARRDVIDEWLNITPLPSDEAVTLLQAWGGARAADELTAQRICELVGRLPFAVRLAGSFMAEKEEDAADFLVELEKKPLKALSTEQRQRESVPLLLERSISRLSKGAQEALGVVGLLAIASFDRAVVAKGLAVPEAEARQLLGELVSYSLLMRVGIRYQVSHALVHTYARRRIGVSTEIARRLAFYYLSLVKEQSKRGPEGFSRLDDEKVHIVETVIKLGDQEDWEATQELAWAVDEYLWLRCHLSERLITQKLGLGVAQRLGNQKKEVAFLNRLGVTHSDLGQPERAFEHHEQALVIAREIGDHVGESVALSGLGDAYSALGQVKRAIGFFEQALVTGRKIGNYEREGVCLGNLGLAYNSLQQPETAIEYFEQALIAVRKARDRPYEGRFLNGLGIAYLKLDQMDRAIECFSQHLTIVCETGDRRGEMLALANLGLTYDLSGQTEKATEYYEQALAISRGIKDRVGESICLMNLGTVYYYSGMLEQATEYFEQALVVAHKTGLRELQGKCLTNLGNVYANMRNRQKSIEMLQEALSIFEELGSRYTAVAKIKLFSVTNRLLYLLRPVLFRPSKPKLDDSSTGFIGGRYPQRDAITQGDALRKMGYPRFAIMMYKIALRITRIFTDRYYEGICLGGLGLAYLDLKQFEWAGKYLDQALSISREIGDQRNEGTWLSKLGKVYSSLGQVDQALELYEHALAISQKTGDRSSQGRWLTKLGFAYKNLGHLGKAHLYLTEALEVLEKIDSPYMEKAREGLTELEEQ
jgi:tetratricopeptide (TPR) repeat protein/transcriptional regulator with XRE-family HTH domain